MSGRRRKNLINKRFGRLIVIGEAGVATNGDALWECKCSCGKTTIARSTNLRTKNTLSCGCLAKEVLTVHGMSHSPEYAVWEGMIQRCTNPNTNAYEYYGGRGIRVCNRWRDFSNFFTDMGERPAKNLTIERKDNDGNYEPTNCRWASATDQLHNTRLHKANKTGTRGVWWDEKNKKYRVMIGVNSKTKHIGLFSSMADAKVARRQAEIKYWGREKGL